MKRPTIKVKLFERMWTISVLSGDAFHKRFDVESDGVTLPDSHLVFIHEEALNLPTLRHELGHVAFDSMCISSANLTAEQLEEVFAEVLGIYGPWILSTSRKIYKALKNT